MWTHRGTAESAEFALQAFASCIKLWAEERIAYDNKLRKECCKVDAGPYCPRCGARKVEAVVTEYVITDAVRRMITDDADSFPHELWDVLAGNGWEEALIPTGDIVEIGEHGDRVIASFIKDAEGEPLLEIDQDHYVKWHPHEEYTCQRS